MNLTFDLPAPKPADIVKKTSLWGTYYYAQAAQERNAGVPLWSMNNQPFGPVISQRDWCLAAMEGTVVVTLKDGTLRTFNYAGKGTPAQTSCKAVFPNLSSSILAGTERVRWRAARGPYGDGAANYALVPYRTIAVDRTENPLGTVIYVAAARGVSIRLPDGQQRTHDGYFFAADVGGAISGNHVDFFIGTSSTNPFAFVKSKPQHTFEAATVNNKTTRDFLKNEHKG